MIDDLIKSRWQWTKCNYEIEKHVERTYSHGNFKVQFKQNWVKHISDIQLTLISKTALLIDVRSADRFFGRIAEPRKNLKRVKILFKEK